MHSNLNNIQIKGVCGVIPSNISYYDDEIHNYPHSQDSSLKLKKAMGYNQHRVVSTEATITDLIIPGLNSLIESNGIVIDDIGAIVLVTQTPDYLIPSTSSIIHGKLGFDRDCYCIDINDGCTGFLKGLFESSSIIRNTSVNNVLLITGDVLSRKVSTKDRNSYPLVGDAISITLIERLDDGYEQPLELKYNGSGALALNIPAGGLAKVPSDTTRVLKEDTEGNIRNEEQLVMQGRDVFTFTQTIVIDFLSKFIENYSSSTIDRYFLHQANLFILERIRKKLKVSSDILPSEVITRYGNSSAATVPMAIVEKYRDTDLDNISERVLLAGFGVGLSWGAALLNIDSLQFCKLLEIEV